MNSDFKGSNYIENSKGPFTTMSEKAMDTFDEGVNAVKEQSEKILESKKVSAVHYLKDYAIAVQEAAVSLQELQHGEATPYLQKSADKLTQLAQFLQSKSVKSMADDVVSFARKNPSIFIAGSLLTGLAIARFAKSSSRNISSNNSSLKSSKNLAPKPNAYKDKAHVKSIVDALDSSTNRQLSRDKNSDFS